MTSELLVTKEKVQRYLTSLFGGAEIDRDGDFTLRNGSTRVWIRIEQLMESHTAVKVFAIPLMGAPASPELFHYVATQGSYPFGTLTCVEKDGSVNVYCSHTLLGEFMDPEEFRAAVAMVAGIADRLDDELKTRFGGRRFHEE